MSKKKGRIARRIFLYLLVFAVVALIIIIYVLPSLTGAMVQTVVAEYGSMQVTDDVTCYFIREETVYDAESSGFIKYNVEEGTAVRKGVSVLSLFPSEGAESGGQSYAADRNGLVSYFIDGYEDRLTPENMRELRAQDVEGVEFLVRDVTRNSTLSSEPLYKIVNDDRWYVVFWVDTGHIVKYNKGGRVTLELSLGKVKGTTLDIIDAGDRWLVLLEFDHYYEEMPQLRTSEARVVTADYEGLLVPNLSVTTVEGQVGVYVKEVTGDYTFTPVSVIASDGTHSLVATGSYYEQTEEGSVEVRTIDAYDEILRDVQQYGN